IRGSLEARRLPLAEFSPFLKDPTPLAGTVDARVTLAGTREAPTFDFFVRGDSLGRGDLTVSGAEADGSYADRELIGSILIDARRAAPSESRLPSTALRGSWSLPVDLALASRETRLLDAPLAARLDIDSLQLSELPLALESVRDVAGVADGHVLVKGTARAPRFEGALNIVRGRLSANDAGLDIRDLALAVRGAGRELTLDRLRLTSGASAGDSLSLTGSVRLGDGAGDRGQVSLRGVLRDLAVLRRGDLADLDLSGDVLVAGTLDSVVVSAGLTVPRGTIYRDAVNSRAAIDLTSPQALELLGADAPAVASTAAFDLVGVTRRIRRSSIRVRAGEELWVRAPTVAAKVGGEVTMVVDRGSLVPTGELTAQRGLYRLDLGVVRRTFDVDSGRVRFFGAQAIAPRIDVYASHDVRQASGGEVTVRAHIAGTLERPTLTLSTDDALGGRVPDTEVISLLLFGAPTFALDGTSRNTVQSVTNVLLPSVGGFVEGALGRLLPVFNTVQLTTAGGGTGQASTRFDLLNNVALSAGKQIGDRTFFRLNSGICRGTADAARDLTPWLGLAVEYRLSSTLSIQASADPGTAPCSRVGTDALSRLQFGLDLFHNWIF
ncbi:MAG: translocation/assembly module TamB, partial [Gemmatimonadaceae bacterium]|nr:translocation/assembly module TamB [Gemmatimonadaceae bacterium]